MNAARMRRPRTFKDCCSRWTREVNSWTLPSCSRMASMGRWVASLRCSKLQRSSSMSCRTSVSWQSPTNETSACMHRTSPVTPVTKRRVSALRCTKLEKKLKHILQDLYVLAVIHKGDHCLHAQRMPCEGKRKALCNSAGQQASSFWTFLAPALCQPAAKVFLLMRTIGSDLQPAERQAKKLLQWFCVLAVIHMGH